MSISRWEIAVSAVRGGPPKRPSIFFDVITSSLQ